MILDSVTKKFVISVKKVWISSRKFRIEAEIAVGIATDVCVKLYSRLHKHILKCMASLKYEKFYMSFINFSENNDVITNRSCRPTETNSDKLRHKFRILSISIFRASGSPSLKKDFVNETSYKITEMSWLISNKKNRILRAWRK